MRRIICFIAIIFLLFPATAYANSGQQVWEGRTVQSAVVTDDACPLVVKQELLTLNISDFPRNNYMEYDTLKGYKSTAVAEYTFANPADYDVNATLVFPFGNLPYYIYIPDSSETRDILPDSDKYSVAVNGKETGRNIRYTFSPGDFDTRTEMAKIRESYAQDSFFAPDTPVVKYTYTAENIGTEKDPWGEVSLSWDNKTDRTALLPRYYNYFYSLGTDSAIMNFDVKSGSEIVLYTIGEKLASPPQLKPLTAGKGSTVTLAGTAEMTFEQFVFSEWEKYDETRGINRTDWYNIFVDCFNRNMSDGKKLIHCYSKYYNIHDSIIAWYQYDMSVPAGGAVTNTVTAPLYPSLDYTYEPPVFGYTYYLSPAATWAAFGNIEINVNTPFYMTGSNLDFEKTQTGYKHSGTGLPEGELTFELSEGENPQKATDSSDMLYLLYLVVITALPLLALIAVLAVTVFIIKKLL